MKREVISWVVFWLSLFLVVFLIQWISESDYRQLEKDGILMIINSDSDGGHQCGSD